MTNIKEKFIGGIEATGNALAPILLQEAYSRVGAVARMFVPMSDKNKVTDILARLMKDFSDGELDYLPASTEFIIALSGMYNQALVEYAMKLKRKL